MDIPTKGIVVDGYSHGNPAPSGYRAIDLETGEILFHIKIGIATNNMAEYIGLCHAILHAIKRGMTTTVYSDSQTALAWVRSANPKTNLPQTEKTKKAFEFMSRARHEMMKHVIIWDGVDIVVDLNVTVSKWYTSEWGEIPADFGHKERGRK